MSRLAALLILSFLASACGGSDKASRPKVVATGSTGQGGDTGTNECPEPKEGCVCEKVGETYDCKIVEVFGSYTTCTVGVYTCGEDLTWGPCIGERTTTTN